MDAPQPTKAWAATRAALAKSLGEIDGVLPGSVVVRRIPCGKPGCACKTGPDALHGPYIQWTRSVGGKTVTRYLSEQQLARYQPWFDNARRLNELVAKLEVASIQAFQSTETSPRRAPSPAPTPPKRRRSSRKAQG